MVGANVLVVDFDLICPLDNGDVFRGRYGIEGEGSRGERGE